MNEEKLEKRVGALTFVDASAVHEVVRYLAGLCDGARELDGQGFNREDARAGHMWARMESLSVERALDARNMVRKYKRQIPDEMWRKMWR